MYSVRFNWFFNQTVSFRTVCGRFNFDDTVWLLQCNSLILQHNEFVFQRLTMTLKCGYTLYAQIITSSHSGSEG